MGNFQCMDSLLYYLTYFQLTKVPYDRDYVVPKCLDEVPVGSGYDIQVCLEVIKKKKIKIKTLFTSLGRSVLEKTVCSVLSTTLGHSFS